LLLKCIRTHLQAFAVLQFFRETERNKKTEESDKKKKRGKKVKHEAGEEMKNCVIGLGGGVNAPENHQSCPITVVGLHDAATSSNAYIALSRSASFTHAAIMGKHNNTKP